MKLIRELFINKDLINIFLINIIKLKLINKDLIKVKNNKDFNIFFNDDEIDFNYIFLKLYY